MRSHALIRRGSHFNNTRSGKQWQQGADSIIETKDKLTQDVSELATNSNNDIIIVNYSDQSIKVIQLLKSVSLSRSLAFSLSRSLTLSLPHSHSLILDVTNYIIIQQHLTTFIVLHSTLFS